MGHNDHLHTEQIGFVPENKMGPGYRAVKALVDRHADATGYSAADEAAEDECDRCQAAFDIVIHQPQPPKADPLIGIGGAPTRATTLPTDAKERKQYPIVSGVLDYFPDAIAAIAHLSWIGNKQHNPGLSLRWDRSKSGDDADTMGRHFLCRGTTDTDGIGHTVKAAWRMLAYLQKEIENSR